MTTGSPPPSERGAPRAPRLADVLEEGYAQRRAAEIVAEVLAAARVQGASAEAPEDLPVPPTEAAGELIEEEGASAEAPQAAGVPRDGTVPPARGAPPGLGGLAGAGIEAVGGLLERARRHPRARMAGWVLLAVATALALAAAGPLALQSLRASVQMEAGPDPPPSPPAGRSGEDLLDEVVEDPFGSRPAPGAQNPAGRAAGLEGQPATSRQRAPDLPAPASGGS